MVETKVLFVATVIVTATITVFTYYIMAFYGITIAEKVRRNTPVLRDLTFNDYIYDQQQLQQQKDLPQTPIKVPSMFWTWDAHPAPIENLWAKIDQETQARRTAFFDTRTVPPRIIVSLFHNDSVEYDPQDRQPLYIIVHYVNWSSLCLPLIPWRKSGNYKPYPRYEIHLNYLYRSNGSLPIFQPDSVQITKLSNCSDLLSAPLKVFYDHPSEPGTFGVCLHKALYSLKEPQQLTNWVEINKALGASKITVYFHNVSETFYTYVKSYIQDGLLEVVDWNINLTSHQIRDHGQCATINDCIYRNMFRVKYLALHDIDEILVPHCNDSTWYGMLSELEKTVDLDQYASLRFYNCYWHFKEAVLSTAGQWFNNLKEHCPNMTFPIYFNRTYRTAYPQHNHAPKLMVRTEFVEAGQVHNVQSYLKGKYRELQVPVDIGLSHHYRIPDPSYATSVEHVYDSVMEKYVQPVMEGLQKTFCS